MKPNNQLIEVRFSEVSSQVSSKPGLYEIQTLEGVPLKVGIAKNMRRRLIAHGRSKQSRLKLKDSRLGYSLNNVQSKQSILAKHLYFDSSITTKYDLTTEAGRVAFLESECVVLVRYTESREAAREVEIEKEASGTFRYVGRVKER